MKEIGLFLTILLLSVSCKKATSTSQNSNSSLNSDAYFTVQKDYNYLIDGTYYFHSDFAYATFVKYSGNTQNYIQVNKVMVNGVTLPYSQYSYQYTDSIQYPFSSNLSPNFWQISGNPIISSFNYTNNDSFPIYTGVAVLPDTINKNQNLLITVSGVSRADEIDVLITDYDFSSQKEKTISTGVSSSNTFTFSASDLSSIPVSTPSKPGFIYISINKNNNGQVIGNTNIHATNQIQSSKPIYLR